jgi:hypothetical protein
MRARVCAITIVLTVLGAASHARADERESTSAFTLFEEGKRLMKEGKVSDACPKFLASLRLVKKVATVLNLAACYERAGQTASAWVRYNEGAVLARQSDQADREAFARQHIQALVPKLARITIRVAAPSARAEVRRDGEIVAAAALETPIPVDPGKHLIEASAPGKKPWRSEVEVNDGEQVQVEVPPLADDTSPPSREPAAPPSAGAQPLAPAAPPRATQATPTGLPLQRTWAVVAAGAGVTGVVVGSIFGIGAMSKWSDAQNHHCQDTRCDPQGGALASDAKSAALISTVAFVAGAAALGAGAVLWFTTPKQASVGLRVVPAVGSRSAGLMAEGVLT